MKGVRTFAVIVPSRTASNSNYPCKASKPIRYKPFCSNHPVMPPFNLQLVSVYYITARYNSLVGSGDSGCVSGRFVARARRDQTDRFNFIPEHLALWISVTPAYGGV